MVSKASIGSSLPSIWKVFLNVNVRLKITNVGLLMTIPKESIDIACLAEKKFTSGEWSSPIVTMDAITNVWFRWKIAFAKWTISNVILDSKGNQLPFNLQCLQIAEKVAFNIASVASYVYI